MFFYNIDNLGIFKKMYEQNKANITYMNCLHVLNKNSSNLNEIIISNFIFYSFLLNEVFTANEWRSETNLKI